MATCPSCGAEAKTVVGGGIACGRCACVWQPMGVEGGYRSVISPGTTDQPLPVRNTLPAVWDLVVADMMARDKTGQERYGTRLQPHNGRDALLDAYQEALDLVVYLRQKLYEVNGK